MNMSHLIDFNDIEKNDFLALCEITKKIKGKPMDFRDVCKGRVMATLFYEPSTRTQFSFQTAMLRLGGTHIGFSDPNSSSVAKGESLKDTIKIVSGYCDIGVIRNPLEGAAFAASLYADIPIINAGDGGHLHPTQTMTDMFTIIEEKSDLEGLKIGICGDLLNGRTVHSLLKAFSRHKNNVFYLISTRELAIPEYIKKCFIGTNNKIFEVSSIEECIGLLDILYMTRIQKERFRNLNEYEKQKSVYVLDSEKMKLAKSDLCILHPLPKIDEITNEVDEDSRAKYFEQARNGMYIRMALILNLINGKFEKRSFKNFAISSNLCSNPRCITNHEKYLPHIIKNGEINEVCAYCDHEII